MGEAQGDTGAHDLSGRAQEDRGGTASTVGQGEERGVKKPD